MRGGWLLLSFISNMRGETESEETCVPKNQTDVEKKPQGCGQPEGTLASLLSLPGLVGEQ